MGKALERTETRKRNGSIKKTRKKEHKTIERNEKLLVQIMRVIKYPSKNILRALLTICAEKEFGLPPSKHRHLTYTGKLIKPHKHCIQSDP